MSSDFSYLAGLRHGIGADEQYRAVVPPLYSSVNYRFDGLGAEPIYDYSRSDNPTRDVLNDALAKLEEGAGCAYVATGLAALTLVFSVFVPVGGRVVACHDCYGGTWRLLDQLSQRGCFSCDFVDLTDLDQASNALAKPADVVLIETPSNPLLRVTDIAAVSKLAHRAGALAVADNTFCSPILQQPLRLGADLVVHSTTKFINGHSDVVGGAVIAKTAELAEKLRFWSNALGLTGSPTDAWLTLRGLRTLQVRMRAHQENAGALVELLVNHPGVERVYYPGLADHPGHELAAHQQYGFGALFSFDVVGGREGAKRLVSGLEVFNLAESLGGVESLISHAATMTHAGMSLQARAAAGLGDGLLRVSAGIEPVQDLLADLGAGLDRVLDYVKS